MPDREFHPFADIVPLMEGEEFEDLLDDIQVHGQRELIVLLDEKILDGRNRYRACKRLGITPRFRDFNCIDGDPIEFVWSANVARRHLTISQRALAGARRAKHERGRPKRTVRTYPNGNDQNNQGVTENTPERRLLSAEDQIIKDVAKIARCSPRTIDRGKYVLNHGTPEEIKQVESGEASIDAMEKHIIERRKTNTFVSFVPKHIRAPQLEIPSGYTCEEWIRKGMTMMQNEGKTAEEAAKALRMGATSFRAMRDIVQLADMQHRLQPQERQLAQEALDAMNKYTSAVPYTMIKEIVAKVWGSKHVKSEKNSEKRIEEFDKSINVIVHACMAKLEIPPHISKQQAKMLLADLQDSVLNLRRIMRQLKEFT